MRRFFLSLVAVAALGLPAIAQTANPFNPLQPRAPAPAAPAAPAQAAPAPAAPAQAAPAPARAPKATATAPADGTAKPKRERSEAQKKNDQMMRDCGTEWRANKPALQAKGQTWRTFLAECRKRKTA